MEVKVLFGHSQVPLKQPQELLLHQVDLCQAEAKVLKTTDCSIASPVLVLWRGVVEVLGR